MWHKFFIPTISVCGGCITCIIYYRKTRNHQRNIAVHNNTIVYDPTYTRRRHRFLVMSRLPIHYQLHSQFTLEQRRHLRFLHRLFKEGRLTEFPRDNFEIEV
jgi:predicted histidine transporter YuiF (NhaC family)